MGSVASAFSGHYRKVFMEDFISGGIVQASICACCDQGKHLQFNPVLDNSVCETYKSLGGLK